MSGLEDLPLFQLPPRAESSSEQEGSVQLSLFAEVPPAELIPSPTGSEILETPAPVVSPRQKKFWKNLPTGEAPAQYKRELSISQEELLRAPWFRHWRGCVWWPTRQTWESLMVMTRLVQRWLQQERCTPAQMLVLVRDQEQASALRAHLQTAAPDRPLPALFTLRDFALRWLLSHPSPGQCLGCPEQLRLLRKVLVAGGQFLDELDLDERWRTLRFHKQQRETLETPWWKPLSPSFSLYERQLKKRGQFDLDDLLFLAEDRLRYQSGLLERCQLRFQTLAVWAEGSPLSAVERRLLTLLSRSQQECLVVGGTRNVNRLREGGFGRHIAERWCLPSLEEEEVLAPTQGSLFSSPLEVHWQHTNNDLDELHRVAKWLRQTILPRKSLDSSPPQHPPWWPSQVQIIYHNRAQLPLLERVFRDHGIPYNASLPPEHLRQKGLWQTLAVLRFLASQSGDDLALSFLLEQDGLIRESTLQQIQGYKRSHELSAWRLIGQFDRIPNLPPNQRILLGYLAEMLIHLRREMGRQTPEQLLRRVWEQLLNCYFFMDPQLPSLEVQGWMIAQARNAGDLRGWLWSLILDNSLFASSSLQPFGTVSLRHHREAVQQSLSSKVVIVLGCEKDFPWEEWEECSEEERREHRIVKAMAPLSEHQLILCMSRYRMQPTTAYLSSDAPLSHTTSSGPEPASPERVQLKLL